MRFDAHGRPRLVDTFLNNAEAREANAAPAGAAASGSSAGEADFIHPAFIPPEILLAGPQVLHDASEAPLLLKSDVYQLAVLLLYLLRGSLPLAPPSPSTQLYGDDSVEAVQQRSMEEIWRLHFSPASAPSEPSHHDDDQTADDEAGPAKHPQCQLCCPPPKPAVQMAPVSVTRTPQKAQHRDDDGAESLPPAPLCLRCWMDLHNLSASFVSSAVNPLSRVSASLPSASSSFLAAWAGLLDLLRLLLDPNPLTRPSAAEALCHAFFVQATAKWGVNAAAARNVSVGWRQKLEQGELPESLCSPFQVGAGSGVGRLNAARMQLNQIAMDPAFGVSGFKSVEVSGTHAGSGTDLASARVCGVCHQPLAPHIHPSSPAACHCLMPFSCADLYAIWKDALASQGVSVQQWLETQSAQTSASAVQPAIEGAEQASTGGLEPLQGVTRTSVIDALPALILLGPALAAGSSGDVNFSSLSLSPPSLRSSQRYFVPLLPMYHMLRRIIVARQQREISQLWAGLDEMDRLAEVQRAEAEASSEAASAAPGSSPKPVRLRKVSPPIDAALASNNGLPSHFSTEGFELTPFQRFVIVSLSALVDCRAALKLYPATRGDMVRVAQERVSALYDQPATARSAAGGEEWNVFLSCSSSSVSPPSIFPASSRAYVWPALLGVSSRAAADYTLTVDGSLILLDAHPESPQFHKDLERSASLHQNLAGRGAQIRLRRMLHVYLARHTEVTYWQGMHELLSAVVAAFPADADSDALIYATFERVVDRPYLRDMFTPLATQALSRKVDAVTRLVSFVDPILSSHLSALGVGLSMVLVAPLFTAWAHNLPLTGADGLYKLWDVLFAFAVGGAKEDEEADYADDERERARAAQARAELEAQESELFYLLPVALLVLLRSFILSKPAAPASPFASVSPGSGSAGSGFNEVLLELTHQLHTIDPAEWLRMTFRCKRDIHPSVLREVVASINPAQTANMEESQPVALSAVLSPDLPRMAPSRGGSDLLLCPLLPLASLQSLLDNESAGLSAPLTKGGSASSLTLAAAAASTKRSATSTSPLLVIDLRAESRRSNPTFLTALAVPSSVGSTSAVEWVIQYVLEWRTQLEQAHVMAVTKAVQAAAQPPPPVAATSFLAIVAESTAQSSAFASQLITAGIQHVCTVAL